MDSVLPSCLDASLICLYSSPLQTLVLSLVKVEVDAQEPPPELIHGLALKFGSFCVKYP